MAVKVLKGDITKLSVDAIVNAANSGLRGGGGVDGAIHRAGGPEILDECSEIGYCATGEAVITTAGKLPAKKVIHTVGPVWHGGSQNESQLLANAYRNSLKLAVENGYSTIAFPNISTGVYGFPKESACDIAIKTVMEFLDDHKDKNLEVTFVCFDDENFNLYQKKLLEYQ